MGTVRRETRGGAARRAALACLALALFAAALFGAAPAQARYAALVMDADTGRVLYARNADTRRYPASLTKIMTLYMVFDALERGKWTMRTRLKVSRRAARQPPTRLGLRPGSAISVRDAILALVTRSANDVAAVVAENMAGTEARFAARMTKRARSLGMSRTVFRNASGLPNRKQKSTARDMARLAVAIRRDFPQYYKFFRVKSFRYGKRVYRNHNKLLRRYAGTDGIKTGYTRASGFNLVAAANRRGHRLIGVVFGGKTGPRRDRHMMKLLDRGFARMGRIARHRAPPLPEPRPGTTWAAPPAMAAVALPVVSPRHGAARHAAAARRAAAAPALPAAAPARVAPPLPPSERWGIQVGVYSGAAPARAAIAIARAYLRGDLAGARDAVGRALRHGGTIHRARVMGLTEAEARAACAALTARRLPCSPVPPPDVDLAAAPARG